MSEKQVIIDVGDGAAIPRPEDKGLLSAWWLSFLGTLAVLAYLLIFHPDPYLRLLKFLPDGIIVTFQVTIASICLALLLGLLAGLGRISRNRIVNLVASTYVEIIRGIPLLVQLFYIYFALGRIVRVPDMVAAIIALGFCYGAYMGEVFRAGIMSIDHGQTEASLSLGFNRSQTMRYVILPQAWRTILPPVGNEFIALLKDTSLVSIIAVSDILRRGREFASESFLYFETYTLIAIIYLLITLVLSKILSNVEQRLSHYERR
ncbi:MAG: amino acid ABC transporter permease [Proteobacteria bacterium]|jgi:polar amino acid transport system permease protein|nr:amino acid ABC transporter permease [Desulfocapsa sp.]MBU3944662.1 amino acid ABC transporter permease [Pseudomonadota bacterium]MCG2743262.1 amino acid ABC transporter permease [Desulfobacteraceae bacterium]MDO8948423.1 amino acid ABC transporter permease [Desulfocapsaceae bacterium]MBU4030309.1 amino acid ABC transporter permease [Pseudomonadota bacterium]